MTWPPFALPESRRVEGELRQKIDEYLNRKKQVSHSILDEVSPEELRDIPWSVGLSRTNSTTSQE